MRHLTIEPNFQKECLGQQNISQRGSIMTVMTMLPFPFLHHTQHGVSWRNLHASNVIFEHHFHFFILHHFPFHFKYSFLIEFSKFSFCMMLHFMWSLKVTFACGNFLLTIFTWTFQFHFLCSLGALNFFVFKVSFEHCHGDLNVKFYLSTNSKTAS